MAVAVPSPPTRNALMATDQRHRMVAVVASTVGAGPADRDTPMRACSRFVSVSNTRSSLPPSSRRSKMATSYSQRQGSISADRGLLHESFIGTTSRRFTVRSQSTGSVRRVVVMHNAHARRPATRGGGRPTRARRLSTTVAVVAGLPKPPRSATALIPPIGNHGLPGRKPDDVGGLSRESRPVARALTLLAGATSNDLAHCV